LRTIEILEGWLELSKCTLSQTFIGTNPTIQEVEEMLKEVKGLEEQLLNAETRTICQQ